MCSSVPVNCVSNNACAARIANETAAAISWAQMRTKKNAGNRCGFRRFADKRYTRSAWRTEERDGRPSDRTESVFSPFPCIFKGFFVLSCRFPYELTHQLSRFFFTICAESLVYHRCQFPGLIVLHLGVNVHSHLAVLVPSQILNSLRIDAFMNQIRDIGVPEKMRCHMEIQRIVDALVRSASLAKLR